MNEVKDDTETLLRWQSVGGGALPFNARAKRTRTSESPTCTKKIAKICNKKLPRFSWICSTLGKFRNRTFGSSLLNFLAIRISLRSIRTQIRWTLHQKGFAFVGSQTQGTLSKTKTTIKVALFCNKKLPRLDSNQQPTG